MEHVARYERVKKTTAAGADSTLASWRCATGFWSTDHLAAANCFPIVAPTHRAISRVDIPAFFNLMQSRTRRMDILSIGFESLLGKAETADPNEVGSGAFSRANSSRNQGRNYLGMVSDLCRNHHRSSAVPHI
jgi:hypothetical protein